MEEGGGAKAPAVYYTPASTDAFVNGYRAWLNKYAGSGVKWPSYVDPALPPSPSKREILDRCDSMKGDKSVRAVPCLQVLY